ncbi:hypothetical protein SEUCBS139899_006227 [Sporothrix eucalyptigena]|uniref:Basic proline-rich protein n=1 Tax=Sporothrix eucalyptigena TaxID=1812306 RepID=A0ABP0ASC3_9PEZI
MEPVPETERMEEFRSSPLPTMRLQSSSSSSFTFASPTPLPPRVSSSDPDSNLRKPANLRRSTEPPSPSSPSWAASPSILPYRPRTASPLSGSHMRSRSTASALNPPAMGRTRSMPGVNGAGHLQFFTDPRTSSPTLSHRPPALTMRTPKKSLVEDVFPSSPTRVSVIHDSDRQLHERNSSPNLGIHTLPSIPANGTLNTSITSQPLARTRRPQSPYRRLSSTSSGSASSATATPYTASAPSLSSTTSSSSITSVASVSSVASTSSTASSASSPSTNTPSATPTAATPPIDVIPPASVTVTPPASTASSPLYRPSDTLLSAPSYSSLGGLSTSSASVPSTPTSTRSRSPSISSLETIPDSPDAEEAALEAERMAQLKAAADAVDGDGKGGRSSLDVPTRGRTLSFGSRDKRKRWSVCGAERRGDLDLETIWED